MFLQLNGEEVILALQILDIGPKVVEPVDKGVILNSLLMHVDLALLLALECVSLESSDRFVHILDLSLHLRHCLWVFIQFLQQLPPYRLYVSYIQLSHMSNIQFLVLAHRVLVDI